MEPRGDTFSASKVLSEEAKRWRFLDDVEDILRTLGSVPCRHRAVLVQKSEHAAPFAGEALPAGVRNAAWAWQGPQMAISVERLPGRCLICVTACRFVCHEMMVYIDLHCLVVKSSVWTSA